jgi:hypothetical protein
VGGRARARDQVRRRLQRHVEAPRRRARARLLRLLRQRGAVPGPLRRRRAHPPEPRHGAGPLLRRGDGRPPLRDGGLQARRSALEGARAVHEGPRRLQPPRRLPRVRARRHVADQGRAGPPAASSTSLFTRVSSVEPPYDRYARAGRPAQRRPRLPAAGLRGRHGPGHGRVAALRDAGPRRLPLRGPRRPASRGRGDLREMSARAVTVAAR